MKAKILLVEDDTALTRGLTDSLQREGYEVRVATRGDQAIPKLRDERPDLVVLDIVLPGRSGLEVLRELRSSGDCVPVLVLSAKGEVIDRVVGLELGADDYLPKPFSVRELLARAQALLRRAARADPPDELTLGNIRFDFRALTAAGPDGSVELTPHDILVLKVLVAHSGELVRRLDIVEEVCGLDSDATLRTVDNHVMALRRAISDDPKRPRWLHTVRGQGYRLTTD